MTKTAVKDEPLEFLKGALKSTFPEVTTEFTREQLYALLLHESDRNSKLTLAADYVTSSDTAAMTQELLKANRSLCKWTFGLTLATILMAVATLWMAISTATLASAPPATQSIGYRFDLEGTFGNPVLLKRPAIFPRAKQ